METENKDLTTQGETSPGVIHRLDERREVPATAPQDQVPDLCRSLETLKMLIQANLGSATIGQGQRYPETLEYLDGLIEKVRGGMLPFPPFKEDVKAPALNILTRREQQILKLIANGLANKNVAERLGISIRTVEVHRSNLTNKLGIKTTAGLVKYAISRGLI